MLLLSLNRTVAALLLLGLLSSLPVPTFAAKTGNYQQDYQWIFTRRIDDHNYPSMGPSSGGSGIVPTLRTTINEQLNAESLRRFKALNPTQDRLDELIATFGRELPEDGRNFDLRLLLLILSILAPRSDAPSPQGLVTPGLVPNGSSVGPTHMIFNEGEPSPPSLQLSIIPAGRFKVPIETGKVLTLYKMLIRTDQDPTETDPLKTPEEIEAFAKSLRDLTDFRDPKGYLELLNFLSNRIGQPSYYRRHRKQAVAALEAMYLELQNRRVRPETERGSGPPTPDERAKRELLVRRVLNEALLLNYLQLSRDGRLEKRTSLKNAETPFSLTKFLAPSAILSFSTGVVTSAAETRASVTSVYSDGLHGFDLGFQSGFGENSVDYSIFGRVDRSGPSRRLSSSLRRLRKAIEDKKVTDADERRERFLYAIYATRKPKSDPTDDVSSSRPTNNPREPLPGAQGVADAFNRSAESWHFLGNGAYFDSGENSKFAAGGFSLTRLFRVRYLDDDSPGIRGTVGLQAIRFWRADDHSTALRPSFSVAYQDRVQTIQMANDPLGILSSKRTDGYKKPKRQTNRELGLIRWNYQIGLEYFPDTVLTRSDSYNLFFRYRFQPSHPVEPVAKWERRITDVTLAVGKGHDRGYFVGLTLTKGMRL